MSQNRNFFDDIDHDVLSSSGESSDVVSDVVMGMYDGYSDFLKTISPQNYKERGFIKEGELVSEPATVLGTGQEGEFTQTEYGWNFRKYANDLYIVGVDDEELTQEEIEERLLEYVKTMPNIHKASFYVFNLFREEDIEGYHPVHRNECLEFKGKFVFVKAVRGWVLLSHERVVHLK